MKLKTAFLAASAAAFTGLCAGFAACEAAAKNGNLSGEPDFLLILGCRVKGDTPDEMLRLRAKAAAKFLNEHKNVRAICCGGIVHDDQTKSEAQAIKEILLQNGIESERIFLEDKSQTTFENFVNAKKIIDSLKTEKEPEIAFISSEFHLMRSLYIAKRTGVKVRSVAAPSPKEQRVKNYIRELLVFPATIAETGKKEN